VSALHDDHDEVLRLRQRVHDLRTVSGAHGWRLDAFDEWRALVERRVGTLEDGLGELVTAEMIADALTEKLQAASRLKLTFAQKGAASVVGLVALADGLKGLIS
jgi:hypothetical protein